jgi:hypothetical protein
MAATTQTARQVIERAARIMRVVALEETPDAATANELLTVLNGLLGNWTAKGLSGYTHATLTLNSTLTTDAALDLGLPYLLSAAAAADFDVALTPDIANMAQDCMMDARKLYGAWTDTLDIDTGLKRMPGLGAGYIDF